MIIICFVAHSSSAWADGEQPNYPAHHILDLSPPAVSLGFIELVTSLWKCLHWNRTKILKVSMLILKAECLIGPYIVNGELNATPSGVMSVKRTHLFGTALLCGPHMSKCFTQTIGTAPFCWEQASRSGRVGWCGGREDFLAEVRVQNNITAETLYGETLPAKTISSSDLDSGYSRCFSVLVALCTETSYSRKNGRAEFKILTSPGKIF